MFKTYIAMDPQDLENRFSTEDSMAYMDSIFDSPSEEAIQTIARIRELLDSLPAREADFVDLYYFCKFRQTDIARLFRVSQPTVCYRLQRAAERIYFLLQLPTDLSLDKLRRSLKEVLEDPYDVQIMTLMYQTTCQSVVAKILRASQGRVRHRFLRSIKKLEMSGEYEEYLKVFRLIAESGIIRREVQRTPTTDPVNLSIW